MQVTDAPRKTGAAGAPSAIRMTALAPAAVAVLQPEVVVMP
jgi:hypothetical protein